MGKQQADVRSARNLGDNYALALRTGGPTHMTLCYCEKVKRGYEQDRVKQLADEYLTANGVAQSLPLPLAAEMYTERCVLVDSAALAQIQRGLHVHLAANGVTVRPLRPLHVDLRGESDAVVTPTVGTRDWLH